MVKGFIEDRWAAENVPQDQKNEATHNVRSTKKMLLGFVREEHKSPRDQKPDEMQVLHTEGDEFDYSKYTNEFNVQEIIRGQNQPAICNSPKPGPPKFRKWPWLYKLRWVKFSIALN